MWGSTIPSIYYRFYCDPRCQKFYWVNVYTYSAPSPPLRICIESHFDQVSVLATLWIFATLHSRFWHPTIRPYRAAMYAGLGLSAVVFVIHGILLHGWEVQNRRMSLDWIGLMALFNLVGVVVYAARVCDNFFQCHLYGTDLSGRYQRSYDRWSMIFMGAVTKYFILQSYLRDWRTCLGCSEHATTFILMPEHAHDP